MSDTDLTPERLPRTIVVANGKGGVGKTSVTAALAAGLASNGFETLAVDLDPQGNLGTEYGLSGHDEGKGLTAAVLADADLRVYPTGRRRLSYLAAGDETNVLAGYATAKWGQQPQLFGDRLAEVLRPFTADGGWIVIDTPPSAGSILADAALSVGSWLLIPTKVDQHSIDGVGTMLHRAITLSADRDLISPLGIVLFDVPVNATKLNGEARLHLADELGESIPVLASTIRHAYKASVHAKQAGVLPAEYAELARTTEQPAWYEAMRTGEETIAFATNADPLASDYASLVDEILGRVGA